MKKLKKLLFLAMLFLGTYSVSASTSVFKVGENTVLSLKKNTTLKVSNLDVNNAGDFYGDTASQLILSSTKETKISGEPMFLSSLKVASNVHCAVSTLSLDGDLTMQSGVMNVGTSRLIIYGDLIGENETTYITASSGTIEKPLEHLSAGETYDVLGLKFTPLHDVLDDVVIRSHQPEVREITGSSSKSALRIYEFSTPKNLVSLEMHALPHETQHILDKELFAESFGGWKKVQAENENLQNVSRISIFASGNLDFPKFITPEEPENNLFEIVGLEEYPNTRLLVISKEGKVLYDLFPYKNDFNGKNLKTGTYYYSFSLEYNSKPIKKSYFEIIR